MKLFWGLVSTLGTFGLFGWSIVEMYRFTSALVDSQSTMQEPAWSASLNLTPMLLLTVFAAISYMVIKRKKLSYRKALWLPAEIEENDEREKAITAQATRAAYVSQFYALPLAGVLMAIYPLIASAVPYFPVLIVLLVPVIQVLVYAFTWHRAYYSV